MYQFKFGFVTLYFLTECTVLSQLNFVNLRRVTGIPNSQAMHLIQSTVFPLIEAPRAKAVVRGASIFPPKSTKFRKHYQTLISILFLCKTVFLLQVVQQPITNACRPSFRKQFIYQIDGFLCPCLWKRPQCYLQKDSSFISIHNSEGQIMGGGLLLEVGLYQRKYGIFFQYKVSRQQESLCIVDLNLNGF